MTACMFASKARVQTLELVKKKTMSVSPNCGPANRCRAPTAQALMAPAKAMA